MTIYKLYVVGESSPNPEDWSKWGSYDLVIAKDKEEALELADASNGTPVAEVQLDKPKHLIYHPSYDPPE